MEKNTPSLTKELIYMVQNHSVLKHEWLQNKKNQFELDDVLWWLSQEYFVSKAFVNWFLEGALLTEDVEARIILLKNVWEELGNGVSKNSHVFILKDFLIELGVEFQDVRPMPETLLYLDMMNQIIKKGFYHAIGALGPANEYLLNLEYGFMERSYLDLKSKLDLPMGKFFQVNLEADKSHSKEMFDLIEKMVDSQNTKDQVLHATEIALDARLVFYSGLIKIENTPFPYRIKSKHT